MEILSLWKVVLADELEEMQHLLKVKPSKIGLMMIKKEQTTNKIRK